MSAVPSAYDPEVPNRPEHIIFDNLLREIWAGNKTVTQANEFLDTLEGYPPGQRFWHFMYEVKGEKTNIRNLVWKNGGWCKVATRAEEIQEMLRKEGDWQKPVDIQEDWYGKK